MITLDDYADRFEHVVLSRSDDGVLEVRLHTDGGPLIWGDSPHTELSYCFSAIAADVENRVVILTGTGDRFCADLDSSWVGGMHPRKWDKIYWHGKRLLTSLLDIEVPVITAVNGPARVHPELAVLGDIVLASSDAVFQDAPHFRHDTVPGDGVHLIWPLLLGPNRGRYFLLTAQRLSATEALGLGVVSEVLPPGELLDRARELASQLAAHDDTILRLTKVALVHELRRLMHDVGYGLALEGLGAYATWPGVGDSG
jgi:enoyl-CoA hydratase/carnithine racemase